MFVHDLNDHIKRTNSEYLQQQIKDVRKIDALTEHLIQAKELLISLAIDLKNYLMIKTNLEGKISVLTQSLCLEQEHSRHLAKLEDSCVELFSNPDLLFAHLNNKSRPQFLCWLLRHHWPWKENDLSGIITKPAQVIYGILPVSVCDDQIRRLQDAADMHVKNIIDIILATTE